MNASEKNRRGRGSGSGGGHMRPAREARVLRIIGGMWRGRKLRFPPSPEIRPTPDRVRETLFNWLAPRLPGARCLDLFAGSGALGLESLSRGAGHVTFVERDPAAARELRARLAEWGATGGHVEQTDALRFLARNPFAAASERRVAARAVSVPQPAAAGLGSAVGPQPASGWGSAAPQPAPALESSAEPQPASGLESSAEPQPASGWGSAAPQRAPALESSAEPQPAPRLESSAGPQPASGLGSSAGPGAGLGPSGRQQPGSASTTAADSGRFDIVFLDPPFDSNLLSEVAGRLEDGNWLAPAALIYVECAARNGLPPLPTGWTVTKAKEAGEVGYHLLTRNLRGLEGE